MRNIATVVLLTLSAALAQTDSAPNITEAFAKAGLKALFAIRDSSRKTDDAIEDAKVERNPENQHEVAMFDKVRAYAFVHETWNMQHKSAINDARMILALKGKHVDDASEVDNILQTDQHEPFLKYRTSLMREQQCVDNLEKAFRKRIDIELPKECNAD